MQLWLSYTGAGILTSFPFTEKQMSKCNAQSTEMQGATQN